MRARIAGIAGALALPLASTAAWTPPTAPQELSRGSEQALTAAEVCGPVLASESLDALYRDPREHLGVTLRTRLQLRGLREQWSSYLTRFGPGDYVAFEAWSDEQVLWEEAEFDEPRALLFVRKGSEAERALRGASLYARFEAVVRADQIFLNRPWIEAFEVTPLPESVNEGALLHASRAVNSMAAGHLNRAEDDLRRALLSNLPAPARQDLELRLAWIEAARKNAVE